MPPGIFTSDVTFDLQKIEPIFNFMLGKVNVNDRKDIMHDAIVKILEAIENNKINTSLYSFSHTVVRRTVTDYYRRKYNMINSNSISVHWSDGIDEEKGKIGVYAFSHRSEEVGYRISDVRNSYLFNIKTFTTQERKIIDYMLYTEDGLDMKPTEISNMLGINKSHASRAMSKLRKVCQA
jgi:RNA polymerase sigma factor (sigma-70 family)